MKTKTKKFFKVLFIVLFALIFIYDTYQIHFAKSNSKSPEHLTVTYENAGNILLQNIQNGTSISMKISVKNDTDHDISFELSFLEVINELEDPTKVTYTLTKEDGNIEIYSDTFPKESVFLSEGDTIEKGSTIDYILTIRVNDLIPNDLGKSLQARVYLNEEYS